MGPEGKGACHAWICQCDFFLRRTDVRFFRCAQCSRKRCGIPRTRSRGSAWAKAWAKAWASSTHPARRAGPAKRSGPAKLPGYGQHSRTGGRPARRHRPICRSRPGRNPRPGSSCTTSLSTTSRCYRHCGRPGTVALWGHDALFVHWRSACPGYSCGFFHHSCCSGSQCLCHARFGCCARV